MANEIASAPIGTRVKSWLGSLFGGNEGSWRGPFNGTGELGGVFAFNSLEDGWQRNLNRPDLNAKWVAPVYSCVMLNARGVSQTHVRHQRQVAGQGFEYITNSPVLDFVRNPNQYETWPQLMFNTIAETLFEGETCWFAERDSKDKIIAARRLRRGQWQPMIDPETGTIWYGIYSDHNLFDQPPDALAPARDICHFRIHTPRHPLIGESAIKAAAMAVGIHVALNQSQMVFFSNLSRPSGFLSTEQKLSGDQAAKLKAAWEAASAALSQGRVPVLTNGLTFQSVGVSQNDQELIEQQRLSTGDIARVFGVPVSLISDTTGAQGATDALINYWLSIGLGSLIEVIERQIERFLELPNNERIELDPAPLLRTDFAKRMEGLSKGVQGGIITPNEARQAEGYKAVDGGQDAFMQRQNLPVSLISQLAAQELAAGNQPAPVEIVDETELRQRTSDWLALKRLKA